MGLWVVAGTYASDMLTDGHVPDWYVETWPKGHKLAQRLIEVRLWDKNPDGYTIRSWEEYQRTKVQVEEDRAKARERQRKRRGSTHVTP